MRLIQDGPPLARCCMCGFKDGLTHCSWCGHYFCGVCRERPFYRSKAAFKEHILNKPPRYCTHRMNHGI